MYGYFVDLRTCGGYFADRHPQLGPQNTHWLVRRSASPQNTRGHKCKVPKWNNCYHSIRTDVVGYEVDVYFGPIRHAVAVLYRPQIYIA